MKIVLLLAMLIFAALLSPALAQYDDTKYLDESSPIVRCYADLGDVVCEFRTSDDQPMFCVALSKNGKDMASSVSDGQRMKVTFKDVFWPAFGNVRCEPVPD